MGERATRRRFTREFKLEAVRQVIGDGRTQKQVADELGLNANLLGRWIKQIRSDRHQEDRRLLIDIRSSFENSDRTYGSPRVLKDLRELGQRTLT